MNKHLTPILLIITSIILWLIFYPQLPDQVPMQWGLDGSVNWTASKLHALLINNGTFIFIYLIMYLAPKFDPKKTNYQQFTRSYKIIYHSIISLFFTINLIILFTSLGYSLRIHVFAPILVGLLLIIFGNYMQTIKPNWVIGIRTPWTLENKDIWRKTHRLGGKVFIVLGIMLMITPFITRQYILPLVLMIILIGTFIPVAYSYHLHRRLK